MLEITMSRVSKKTIGSIFVTLNDQSLQFTGNGKASVKLERVIKDTDDNEQTNLFDCFNDYISGTFDTDRKIELFRKFERAHKIVDSPKNIDYNTELAEAKPIVDEIIDFIDVHKFCSFIHYSKYLQIPKGLSEAASKGDYPTETTITDQDYVEMVKLAFVTRVVYPIIFGLMGRFDVAMGVGYSELVCGGLLKDNPLITNLPGWRKLSTYVHYAFNKRPMPSQADSVTSTEDFVDKVLFNTLFSRLCCAVLPETEEGKNLATGINASVKQHETGSATFRDKDRPSDEDDDKRSIYDKYQISEAVKSSDEVGEAEYFSFGLFDENDNERITDRFKHQCIGLEINQPELVEKVYDNISPNWDFELHDHILKILQLTYVGVVSPLIFEACDYVQLTAAICLAQVKLSEQGYKYLPSVLGAIHDPDGMRSLPDGLKLSTEDKEYIASICDIQSRNNEGRSFNEGLVAATTFLDKFGNGRWKSNLEYGVLDSPVIYGRVKKGALFGLEISPEVKVEFMRLIRQVND